MTALVEERRLDVLDGLRGIAVLLVLWYHVWEISWLPAPAPWLEFIPETGFIGVHLFFFLSGFVIALPFVRAAFAGTKAPTWGLFAWRRARKILPSYWLSILVAYAIGYAQTQGSHPFADVVTHLLFIHTWFAPTAGAINGVLWTLAVEVEFYVIFPLVWWCFKRSPWITAGVMIAPAWAWRAWVYAHFYNADFVQIYENLPGYLDIFACGLLAAHVYVNYGARIGTRIATRGLRIAATLLAIAGFAYLVILLEGIFGYRLADQWAYVWQINRRPLFGLAFAAMALGSLLALRPWRALIGNRVFLFLGAISYNLYLYHQMLARELLLWHIPPSSGADSHFDPQWQVAYTGLTFALCIAQAALVTYLFERPLMRLRPHDFVAFMSRLRRGTGT